ncbi:MAG: hypothetical protein U0804_20780 [Gemmataceae bacterium]
MVRRWLAVCLGAVLAAPAAAQPGTAPPGAVRGLPVAAQPGQDFPLPTDGLMAPAPVVPPRTAYQLAPAVQPPPPNTPPRTRVPDLNLPEGMTIPLPGTPGRSFQFARRYGRLFNISSEQIDANTQRIVFMGGVIVSVSPGADKAGKAQPAMEFATDSAVVWVTGTKVNNVAEGFEASPETKREVEVYLTGNVVIRTVSAAAKETVGQTLRAEEIYYDVARNRAVAVNADLEMATRQAPDGVHLTGKEIRRLDRENWEVLDGSAYSSKLPSDPGFQLTSTRATLRERTVQPTNIFGIPYRDFDGNPVEAPERILTIRNAVTRLADLPVFYLPYLKVDANDPLGPLTAIGLGQDRIFGTQVYTTWDVYKLLALRPPAGHRWRMDLDYLSDRGPAAGTNYDYTLPPDPDRGYSPGGGYMRLYGLSDGGVDVVGGGRGVEPTHPDFRGRGQWRHQQELFSADTYFQGQLSYLSDQNFLEQFYKAEFDLGPNQDTFAYLTHRYRNMWAAALVQPKIDRNWLTQTMWLPRVDGAITGESFWDLLSYNARANAGYALLRPSQQNPFAVMPTDRYVDTGRFNLNQEVSVPFDLGPVRLVPYGTLDLAYYTQALTGDDLGRVYGGGGLSANLPFSRLYEGATSELLNVRGLYHKASVGANYYYAQSSTAYTNLPQLDRLNDNTTDYTYNYARTYFPQNLPGPDGLALAYSPVYDAQRYAIRRVVDNRTDTLDDMQVLRLENRNRFQTKRGYPGLEHTVDVFSLNLGASFFPNPARDNFDHPWAFLEYDGLWNVGDRVALMSAGWVDPFDLGARYWNVGASLDRPDRTSFYVGYRQTDPVNSKTVTGSVTYQLSRRYFTNVGVSYDFGMQQALTNSFSVTRTGSDMTFTFGVTYNALVNNFGVQFLLVPNLVAYSAQGRLGGGFGSNNQR